MYTRILLIKPIFYKNSKILCHNESAAFVTFKMDSMEGTTLLCWHLLYTVPATYIYTVCTVQYTKYKNIYLKTKLGSSGGL